MSRGTIGQRSGVRGMWRPFAVIVAVAIAVLATSGMGAPGDRSPDGVWTEVDAGRTPAVQRAAVLPSQFTVFSLNEPALAAVLAGAPMEFAAGAEAVLTLPMPDGSFARFSIEESPILSDEMRARYPEIQTFQGQGIDDPTATVRFDLTIYGFRAQVLSVDGTVLIDPVERGNTDLLMSFRKSDYPLVDEPFVCNVTDEVLDVRGLPPTAAWGEQLRTYRLAITATGEYTQRFGGAAGANAQITTTVNRVTGIYERDMAIRLNLVRTVIFTDPSTDPFGTAVNGAMLDANQTVCDDSVGSGNYDIGHVFSATGGGGLAACGVCQSNKARGGTSLNNPLGDVFDVDYVSHEMGHQFCGSHTFNGSTGSCGGGNRVSHSAYEPGSGTTIMAYAGICGAENVQSNSDAYFHARSLDQILTYREGSGNCGAATATGNTPPTADALLDQTIPRGTPFRLTGSGFDVNGDALTYCWEQYDLGDASPPTDFADGPLFRSRMPVSSPSRTFPQLTDILSGTATPWELLPTVDRTMTFRLTVRDNRAGGGGVDWDDMTVTVAGDPFFVTYPNGGESLAGGCPVTVTWTVGGGSVADNVQIWLSTDGGLTLTQLLATTANDGSHAVNLPCLTTSNARIYIGAVESIFFDYSNGNFSITSQAPTIAASATGGAVNASCQRLVTFSASIQDECSVLAADVDVAVNIPGAAASWSGLTVNESQAAMDEVSITGSVLVYGLTTSPATVQLTFSAEDVCGNLRTYTASATVYDAIAPVISCPSDKTFECDAIGDFGYPTATDNCDPNPAIALTARDSIPGACPQEYQLVLGYTATDFAGNTDFCEQTIMVIDTTPPVVTCYDTLGFVFTSPTEAEVYWDASATDNCGIPTVTCDPVSGTTFGIGLHSVTCIADDGCANADTCSFRFRLVPFDLHPTSCPNPISVKSVLPAALVGTADFDVQEVNVSSLRLNGVAPERWAFEDVTRPVANDPNQTCECTTGKADGLRDLTLKFNREDVIAAIPPGLLVNGGTVMLQITGEMTDGTPLAGGDCLTIRLKPKEWTTTDAPVSAEELTSWNSPNPFNPSTVIYYTLPQPGHVSIAVFNMLGQEVTRLVDVWQEAGQHSVEWSGEGVASGVYLYRLETTVGTLTEKMLLLK